VIPLAALEASRPTIPLQVGLMHYDCRLVGKRESVRFE
jgi:hypothetical protein